MPRILAAIVVVAAVLIGAIWLLGPTRRAVPEAPETDVARPTQPAAAPEAAPSATVETTPTPGRVARRAAESSPSAPTPTAAPAPAAEAAPVVGTLRIESDVPGAQVFLDRQFVGTVPVTAENVKPGAHQLNVSADGFDGIARTIEVEPGTRDVVVRFREVRLNARLPVVHKHRMGSCEGTLIATTQGLRYETADKDDQFAVAFGDVDTFAVDYVEKNLKVKLRKGKQFNFTDPGGNADPLFVFHRDVDKARQRLARGDAPVRE